MAARLCMTCRISMKNRYQHASNLSYLLLQTCSFREIKKFYTSIEFWEMACVMLLNLNSTKWNNMINTVLYYDIGTWKMKSAGKYRILIAIIQDWRMSLYHCYLMSCTRRPMLLVTCTIILRLVDVRKMLYLTRRSRKYFFRKLSDPFKVSRTRF